MQGVYSKSVIYVLTLEPGNVATLYLSTYLSAKTNILYSRGVVLHLLTLNRLMRQN